jgi:hypothetical protein
MFRSTNRRVYAYSGALPRVVRGPRRQKRLKQGEPNRSIVAWETTAVNVQPGALGHERGGASGWGNHDGGSTI